MMALFGGYLPLLMVFSADTHTFPTGIGYFQTSLRDFLFLEHSNPSSQTWPVFSTPIFSFLSVFFQFISSTRLWMAPDNGRGHLMFED
jgi:hypothetical protein